MAASSMAKPIPIRVAITTLDAHLADAFERAGALARLEAFASFNGADFYGLPRNTGRITLARQAWTLPETLPFGDAAIKPLCGGETLAWRMQA